MTDMAPTEQEGADLTPDGRVEEQARAVVKKKKRSMLRQLVDASLWALASTGAVVLIPIVQPQVGSNVCWTVAVGVIAFLCFLLLRAVADDRKLGSRLHWAEYILRRNRAAAADAKVLDKYKSDLALQEAQWRALVGYQAGLANALRVHSSVRSSPGSCSGTAEGKRLTRTEQLDAAEVKAYLTMLCGSVHDLLRGFFSGADKMRVGIVVRSGDYFLPLAVFIPSDDQYCSTHRFPVDCFSGQVLGEFQRMVGSPGVLEHTVWSWTALDLVDEGSRMRGPAFTPLDHKQSDYIKSIVGNVICFRGTDGRHRAVGVLSIDSPDARALSEADFRKLTCFLHPTYRLLAAELALLERIPNGFELVWAARPAVPVLSGTQTGGAMAPPK